MMKLINHRAIVSQLVLPAACCLFFGLLPLDRRLLIACCHLSFTACCCALRSSVYGVDAVPKKRWLATLPPPQMLPRGVPNLEIWPDLISQQHEGLSYVEASVQGVGVGVAVLMVRVRVRVPCSPSCSSSRPAALHPCLIPSCRGGGGVRNSDWQSVVWGNFGANS